MGTGLGSENQLINPQTLLLKNEGELDNIQAQVAGIVTNEPLPRAVVFSTDVHESVTVTDYLINEVAYYFTSSLTPASVITSMDFIIMSSRVCQTILLLPGNLSG